MNEKCKKNNMRSEEHMAKVLFQIEKAVDEKLKNIKAFAPILFTIITSVIAFLLAIKVDINQDSTKVLFFALGILLISFVIMMVSFFGRTHYKAKNKKTKTYFEIVRFDSYCYLSDKIFLDNLKEYAQRDLTESEFLTAIFIKQKINEYVFRRTCANWALSVIEIGALILAITCFLFPFVQ